MKLVAKNKNFFGLDLGLNSIRMVQLNHSQSKNLVHYSFTPVSPKLMLSESKTDRDKIISTLKDLYVKSGINTKNVAGFACIIPQLPILIANRFNLNVELGNSWGNVNYDLNIRTELMSYSYIFSVASGLAQRQT